MESHLQGLPHILPIFPLDGALLLPSGNLPLNVFEPRYIALIDHALQSEHRMIGMVQTAAVLDDSEFFPALNHKDPALSLIGCAGRITVFNEISRDRYQIILSGLHRFKIKSECPTKYDFRLIMPDWEAFEADHESDQMMDVERKQLLRTFREYLYAHDLDTDWEGVDEADNETLVNMLCMMAPYGEKEKQALLEAKTLSERAIMLIAITERHLVQRETDNHRLQ